MEVRSESVQVRLDKVPPTQVIPRTRLQVWFIRVCSSILIWTCLVQLVAVGELWHPKFLSGFSYTFTGVTSRDSSILDKHLPSPPPPPPPPPPSPPPPPPPLRPERNYKSNGFLKVSCNGGLNQMRAAICDMVAVARLLNLTLVVPELDKTSFWADPSNFEDIFDVTYFINSLRDEVRVVRRLPKKFNRNNDFQPLKMAPISWSNENYYLQQILPLFSKHEVVHFNRTDTRLANNGIQPWLQKLRCRVNFEALRFTPQIEALGSKLVNILQSKGSFVALHLRYEMDMLAFSGCAHGCTIEETEELKRLRYAFPWWREKEIVSEERRSQGLCPLTPEEAALALQALGFDNSTQIYIASGEIYGSERRLSALRSVFPLIVKKEKLLDREELRNFQNHSSQMAALDFMVSVASDIFIPSYDGNMARVVEGHRRYLGFKKTIKLDRKKLVELVDKHLNGTILWDEFSMAVRSSHEKRMGQADRRIIIPEKPKEEDYFYANPLECFCDRTNCSHLLPPDNNSTIIE
ncbi:rhamnogalacturonan I rhamnosyltransferase 1 [Impatiens glandulifera]|uniref:rhamnogalacturonan I rhamnosyltransferase 1 n=1 Tax=Impatiens glandulifera TaxID=253017 RepID=UPI001FB19563|nr:rhamnogalacturonan I rhamnosyltransferase 1 [Impatiens glandulifera]